MKLLYSFTGRAIALIPAIMAKLFLSILFSCIWAGTTFSQTNTALPVGQRVPAEFWECTFQVYDHEQVTAKTLEEYRGKPLILAFWSTTCNICIVRFPFFNQLLQENPGKLNILLVNSYQRDSVPLIQKRFEKLDSTYLLPGIIQDNFLSHLFPHVGVPHYIWIDSRGTLLAKTASIFMTEENILKFTKLYEKR